MNRRHFCRAALSAPLACTLLSSVRTEAQAEPGVPKVSRESKESKPRIRKAVKITMITGKAPLLEKFTLAKEVGFEGVSLFAPDRYDRDEALRARDATGLVIHNINNSVHWKVRLSDPDPEVRARSLAATKAAIQFAHDVGATSILQIIGKVTDPTNENHSQVHERSIAELRKAIPLAERLGVHILCENVANGFCEDAKDWADYLDEIGSPWVQSFFDVGNHQRFGGADHWLRALGTRVVKLDIKDHDSTLAKHCSLFDGDVDWPAVRRELARLRFSGWATAEVRGGDRQRLAQVAQRMDRALGLCDD